MPTLTERNERRDWGSDSRRGVGSDVKSESIGLVIALEEKFGIEIPDEDAEKVRTVGDVIRYVAKKTNRDLDSE